MLNKCLFCAALALATPSLAIGQSTDDITIHRDQWGVPHIYGPTDASVVFGAAYAQAEDNWAQVEDNFIRAIGRGAEIHGENSLMDDYLARGLEINRRSIEEYNAAPPQMQRMYDAYAAGFNHYLERHPEAPRRLLDRVEPWFTLALIRFKYHHNEYLGYAGLQTDQADRALRRAMPARHGMRLTEELSSMAWSDVPLTVEGERALGSNEWAVSGSRTASGYPMLLINPHVTFFGLSTYWEVHLHSAEGLVFSGLTRFGFMLPYMGNNERLGWAYTDNYGDHSDLYIERLNDNRTRYFYGDDLRELTHWVDTITVRTEWGLEPRAVRYAKTHHGPILGYTEDGRPLAPRLAKLDEGGWFEQWYHMQRAQSLDEWRQAASVLNVPYMNTMYADRDGNILYVYNHAIPRRSEEFDWSQPVDGSDPRTEWNGYHSMDELPQFLNPSTGFLQNTNSDPLKATDGLDVSRDDFPAYMIGREVDNRRARSSRRVLRELHDLTLDDFAEAVLTTRLIAAEDWLPGLFEEYEKAVRQDPAVAADLAGPIEALRAWDHVATVTSVPTTLFVRWGWSLNPDATTDRSQWLPAFANLIEILKEYWGTWEVPWGDINRIQRPDAAGNLPFSDTLPSLPVAGAPGGMGSVFTFHGRRPEGGRRFYGFHGNSFVKVVEFGPEIKARSVFVFGQSGDPESPHYFDQAQVYSDRTFKDAWFSDSDVAANAVSTYRLAWPR